jgi:integrase
VRLAALRSAFDALIAAEAAVENRAANVQVGRSPSDVVPHPLTPIEVERLRVAGRLNPRDTLRPACAALALTGATHMEIASTVVADFDSAGGRVCLGRTTMSERVVNLDTATSMALAARIRFVRWAAAAAWDPDSAPLAMHRPVGAYQADSVAPTVSMNLSRALRRAGIARPGVRPRSCREYAANAVYARTGRVEDVAAQLGIVSLDSAFRLIDPDWQRRWGAHFGPRGDG